MQGSIDKEEIAKFERMAAEWWDPKGKFRPLHRMQPCRLGYITRQIAAEYGRSLDQKHPFAGLRILDIGCGGGLLSEPMARLGAEVVGADASDLNISVAKLHAEQMGLSIDYRMITAEALAEAGERFDVVLNMEVIEHVAMPQEFVASCARLLRPNGIMFLSTLNRTAKSYAAAIVAAEIMLRWLPRGTHEWSKFITPDELQQMAKKAGLEICDQIGFVYNPLMRSWSLQPRDLSINYAMIMRLPAQ